MIKRNLAVLQHITGRPYIVQLDAKGHIKHAWGPHLTVWYAANCIERGGPKWWDDERLLPMFAAHSSDYSIVWPEQVSA